MKICPFMSKVVTIYKFNQASFEKVYCKEEGCMAWQPNYSLDGIEVEGGYCKLIDKGGK